MPSSVGTYVFYYCYNLKHITIPRKSSSPITSLTNYMFYANYSLQSISVPKTITTIGNNLLYNACALKRFVMPSTITSVGSSLLYADYSVNHVYISTSLTEIKTTDFYRCYSLCADYSFCSFYSSVRSSSHSMSFTRSRFTFILCCAYSCVVVTCSWSRSACTSKMELPRPIRLVAAVARSLCGL